MSTSEDMILLAWDPNIGKVVEVWEVHFRPWRYNIGYNKLVLHDGDGTYEGDIGRDNIILLQNTGLRDRNGHMIHEGDIVKIHVTRTFGVAEETLIMAAALSNGIWNISPDWIEASEWWGVAEEGSTTVHYMEIIGNQFENPELLKP